MLNLFALGIIGASILFAAATLVREERASLRARTIRGPAGGAVPLDLCAGQPTTLDHFDPRAEALLVQLPSNAIDEVEASDFATRPAANGRGLELLLRQRVVLHLPGISAGQPIELCVEPCPA